MEVSDLNGMLWIIGVAMVVLDDTRRTAMYLQRLQGHAPAVIQAEIDRLNQNDEHLSRLLRALEEALGRAGASDTLDELRDLLRVNTDDLAGGKFDSPSAVAQRFLLDADHAKQFREDRVDVA